MGDCHMTKLWRTILDGVSRPAGRGTGTGPRNRPALSAAAGLMVGSLALAAAPVHAASRAPHAIAAAVADQTRPASDRERDAARKPAACLAFAGVHPGTTVAELFPGKGYFTR